MTRTRLAARLVIHRASIGLVTVALAIFSIVPASAAVIHLDFDTHATGSLIITAPLVTPSGTITASNAELTTNFDVDFAAAGASSNNIDHLGDPTIARLSFDFDVEAISLIYGGNLGDITIEARNSLNVVVDSFFQASTFDGEPAGPITLSGSGIRSLGWFETSGNFASLDNLLISTAVPEPATLALLGIAFAGLGFRRGKRAAN